MSRPRNPNDLIRIEDAIKVLCRKTCHPGVACPDIYCKEMWDEFEDVERVEVVRCRDCKKAEHDTIFREYWCQGREVDPDGYCSDGERKDGDHAEGTIQKERS